MPNRYRFFAWVDFDKARPELLPGNRRWLARLTADSAKEPFRYAHEGRRAWLEHALDLDALVGQGNIEQQAAYLARWIVSTFRKLGQPPA
jgi:hypothetical protein